MNLFCYTLIFIIGTLFGSFFTLAVYRIPKKEDILIKHSYCPSCNHKLGFFDLFPVLSYIFLKGKCRWCGTKIRPRYLILELLSGFTFLIIAIVLKVSIYNINDIIYLSAVLIYISILFIILGIDKENIMIPTRVIFCGYIFEIIYIIYQCTLGNINVYQYVIYLFLLIILLILSNISLKINMQEKYYIKVLYLSLYMIVFWGSKHYILTVMLTLVSIVFYRILSKNKKETIPIAFYLCISNIIITIFLNAITNFVCI